MYKNAFPWLLFEVDNIRTSTLFRNSNIIVSTCTIQCCQFAFALKAKQKCILWILRCHICLILKNNPWFFGCNIESQSAAGLKDNIRLGFCRSPDFLFSLQQVTELDKNFIFWIKTYQDNELTCLKD